MTKHESPIEKKLRAVYSEVAVDHILDPRRNEALPHPDGFAEYRSSCGESMKIWLKIKDGVIEDAAFWTDGCAATIASGSMAVNLVQGTALTKALELTARDIADALQLPEGNAHCAELAWNSLRLALADGLRTQQQPWKKLYR